MRISEAERFTYFPGALVPNGRRIDSPAAVIAGAESEAGVGTIDIELGDCIERFDHVSIAVNDIRAAVPLATLMGGTFFDGGLNHIGDFWWAQWELPQGRLEMIEPVHPADSDNFLVRFLRDRGEGVHHLTFKVTDIEEAVARAEGLGFEVLGVDLSHDFWKEAFVHPRGASGVLVQLAEWIDKTPPEGHTLEDALAPGG